MASASYVKRRCAAGVCVLLGLLPPGPLAGQGTIGVRPDAAVGAYFDSLYGRPRPPSYLANPGAFQGAMPAWSGPGAGGPGLSQGNPNGIGAHLDDAGCPNPVNGRCPAADESTEGSCVDGFNRAAGDLCDEVSKMEGRGRSAAPASRLQ